MMIPRTICLLLTLLVGCSTLPGHDDPRDETGRVGGTPDAGAERGTCGTDFSAACNERAASQCNGGCMLATVCHARTQGTCAVIRNADACDGNSACRWSSGFCRPRSSDICGIYESQTACAGAMPSYDCTWSSACDGFPECFKATTSAACGAQFGCKWTPF